MFILIGILLYAGFNLWVYQYGKSGAVFSPPKMLQEVVTSGAGFGGFQGESQGRIPTPAPRFSPPAKSREAGSGSAGQDLAPPDTPTPRPTGQGSYACSAEGDCNVYSDAARAKYCTVTYADNRCLDQCGDITKQCTK